MHTIRYFVGRDNYILFKYDENIWGLFTKVKMDIFYFHEKYIFSETTAILYCCFIQFLNSYVD